MIFLLIGNKFNNFKIILIYLLFLRYGSHSIVLYKKVNSVEFSKELYESKKGKLGEQSNTEQFYHLTFYLYLLKPTLFGNASQVSSGYSWDSVCLKSYAWMMNTGVNVLYNVYMIIDIDLRNTYCWLFYDIQTVSFISL